MADIDGLYKRAEEAFQKHNYDYAVNLFQQILLLQPDHSQTRKALKLTILKKFQEQGAPGMIKLKFLRGQIELHLRTSKDPEKKTEAIQKYLCDDPGNTRIRTILADLLLQKGHSDGAATEAEMAMADDPANVPAAKILVAAYKNLGKVKEAQTVLERVSAHMKEDRELERLQRDLAAMQTMKAGFTDAKDFHDVIKDKDQAAKLEIQHHLIQTEEQFQSVVDALQNQLGENPTESRIPKKLGDLYFDKKKDFSAARDWYKKASQLAPQDSVLKDKVEDCAVRLLDIQIEEALKGNDPKINELRAQRLKLLIQCFERRVADRPTDMVLRFELGKCYYLAGPAFLDMAIGEFQQSVKDPKRKSESHLYLGQTFQSKKMYDLAEKQYEQSEVGVIDDKRKLYIAYNRAKCNAEAGKFPKAVELGKLIMEIDINYKDISKLVEKWESGQK
jgi:tetratricopeptide (TPR) repeat protein